jgi:hypothetical protein
MEMFKQKEQDFRQKKELQMQSFTMKQDKVTEMQRTLK